MVNLNCSSANPCFPCLANERIQEIINTLAKENRKPTDVELDESAALTEAMTADIVERSLARQEILDAIRLGIIPIGMAG